MNAKLIATYTYRDVNGEIVFQTEAADGEEADKLFKEATGKEALSNPWINCTCTYEIRKENDISN